MNLDIYQYEDYRTVLSLLYNQAKEEKEFSCRKFAKKAGFSNPAYINDVIKGKRNLSKNALNKILQIFPLSKSEGEYFTLLVNFAHSKKASEKESIYKAILFRRSHSSFVKLNPAMSKYYSDFRYALIRCAIMTLHTVHSPSDIAQFIRIPIPLNTIKKYLKDLLEWNLLTQKEDHRYETTGSFVEPSPQLLEQLKVVNKQWIDIAADAQINLPKEERYISSMLLSVSEETRQKIENKLLNMRNEIWELVKEDTQQSDNMILLNTQLIPMSQKKDS